MNWLHWLRSPQKQIDDPTFSSISFENGVWNGQPTSDRSFMVSILADRDGPSERQRAVYCDVLADFDNLVLRACEYLDARVDHTIEIDCSLLCVYGLVIDGPETSSDATFAIELFDQRTANADAIFGVQFVGAHPINWYMDH